MVGVPVEVQRDNSDFWFACVDIKVLTDKELSPIDKVVYAVLCVHVNIQSRNCKLKIKTIAKEAGCSVRSVQNSLKALTDRGIIERKECFYDGKQISSSYHVIGHRATCYVQEDTPDVSENEGCKSCAPRTTCTPPVHQVRTDNDNSFNDNISLTREAELPNPTDAENQNPPAKPEEVCTPDDAPDIMKPSAEYLLLKTGRKFLSWPEISALRILAASHFPSRVQKEIDTACERFKRKGRPLSTLTFGYIAGALQHQQSRSPIGRKKPKAEKEQEAVPVSRTFTPAELDELEAKFQERG